MTSGSGFSVNLDELQAAENGVRDAVSVLGEPGDGGGLLNEMQTSDIGHPELTAALNDFREHFDAFVRKLVHDGQSAADALEQARLTYAHTDHGAAAVLSGLADDLGFGWITGGGNS